MLNPYVSCSNAYHSWVATFCLQLFDPLLQASSAGVAQQPDPRAVSTRRDESYEPHWEAGDVVWRQPQPRSLADETW